MVWVNNGCARQYLDGEKREAGAIAGYAPLKPGDVIDPGEGMEAFEYRWTHLETGKTGVNRVACMDRADFLNYLAHWNSVHPTTWRYDESA